MTTRALVSTMVLVRIVRHGPRRDETAQKDRYTRAKEVFVRLYLLPEAERRLRARQACFGDPDLLREVEQLLEYHECSGSLGPAGLFGAWEGEEDPETPAGGPLPETLGRFRIVRQLGCGAMGVVYLAEDPVARRRVAVKILPGYALSELGVARLRLEAEALRRLDHPGIVQFQEAGVLPVAGRDVPFLVMEHVSGRPWRAFWREDRASDRGRTALMAALCEAVGHAHDRGIVHRDLKPENILVEESGQPKVLDFGLARMIDLDARPSGLRTRPGLVVGTLRYMSPEQARGDNRSIDARTDVYALGVIGYELLVGRPPYELPDAPAEAIARILAIVPPRARRWRPSLPAAIEAILEKALSKEPSLRYATAGEMAADLRRHLAGERVAAQGATFRLCSWRVRHRLREPPIAALVTLIALVGSFAALQAVRRRHSEPDVSAALRGVYARLEDADRRRHSAAADDKQLDLAERDYERVRRYLARLPDDESARGLSIYACWRLGEIAYFRGTAAWDPAAIKRALDFWSLANSFGRPRVLPQGLDATRPLYGHYIRLGQHHPMAGLGLAHAALVFYENPAWHARRSLWCRRVARNIQDSLGVRGYHSGPLTEQHLREDDLLGRYELAGALGLLAAIVDSTALLDTALANYARAGPLSALEANPAAGASVLQGWGATWLERAERTGSRGDLDSAEACLRRAIEMRDRQAARKRPGKAERMLARSLCRRAEKAHDPDTARAGLAEAIALLETGRAGSANPGETPESALWALALADALIDRATWMMDRTGLGSGANLREDLDRADSLLWEAAPQLPPARMPAQAALVEFSRGRLARARWQESRAAGDRESARRHLGQAREHLPHSQYPALHRQIQAEVDRLADLKGEPGG